MKTLDDEILAVQRMARCSRYWARAARATAAEFRPEFDALMSEGLTAPLDELRTRLRQEQLVDLRTVSLDKESEARRHDQEASELEAIVQRLEEMRTVLQSFCIDPPDADGDIWLKIGDQGNGRQAAFNLGKPSSGQPGDRVRISHNVAALLETARQSALGGRP